MGMLDGLTPHKDIQPCKVGQMLLELETSDATILQDALTNGLWSAHGLSKALRTRGIAMSPDTLRAHMQKACRCSKA